jgi:hypothetical protein
MGYKVKLQKINRPTNKSYFVSVPVVFVEAMEMEKGEEFEWILEDKNTLLFQRVKKKVMRKISS